SDDDAGTDRLRLAACVNGLDENPIPLELHLRRGDPALDAPAERLEVSLEDPLRLVLRQAAQELVATVEAFVRHRADLHHPRAIQAGAMDMLGGIEECRQRADRIEDLER